MANRTSKGSKQVVKKRGQREPWNTRSPRAAESFLGAGPLALSAERPTTPNTGAEDPAKLRDCKANGGPQFTKWAR